MQRRKGENKNALLEGFTQTTKVVKGQKGKRLPLPANGKGQWGRKSGGRAGGGTRCFFGLSGEKKEWPVKATLSSGQKVGEYVV